MSSFDTWTKSSIFETCFGHTYVDELLALISNIIGIIVTFYLGVAILRHQRSQERNERMPGHLVLLYFMALTASCLILSGSTVTIIVCPLMGVHAKDGFMLLFVYSGFVLMFSSLLTSFVFRVYVTFKGTTYEMSKIKLCLCLALLAMLDVSGCTVAALYRLRIVGRKQFWMVHMGILALFSLLSIWPIYHFVRNLIELAKTRSTSPRNLEIPDDPGNLEQVVSILEEQQSLVNLTSKFVSLFFLAIGTSLVGTTLVAVFRSFYIEVHPGIFWSIDCVVNILCLYLYHSFAQDHYNKYCWRIQRCCGGKVRKKVKKHNQIEMRKHLSSSSSATTGLSGQRASQSSGMSHLAVHQKPNVVLMPSVSAEVELVSSPSSLVPTTEDTEFMD